MRLVAEPGTFTLFAGPDAEHGESAKFTFTTPDGKPVPIADGCR